MRVNAKMIRGFFAGTLLVTCGVPAAFAETTTTVKTTTVTTAPLVLPSGSYIVIDPVTGETRGSYDLTTRRVNGQPLVNGQIVVEQVSGRVVAVSDTKGNLLDITSAPVDAAMLASIESRRAQLDRMVADALANGSMTPAQAAPLRAELAKIATLEATAQGTSTVSYAQVVPMTYQLNAVVEQVVPARSTTTTTTTVVSPVLTSRISIVDGRIVYLDDLTFRRFVLERRVDDEYSAGRLAQMQVADLKKKLNEAAALQARYNRDGIVSESNRRRIEAKLDQVNASLDRDVAIINEKRAKIGIRVN